LTKLKTFGSTKSQLFARAQYIVNKTVAGGLRSPHDSRITANALFADMGVNERTGNRLGHSEDPGRLNNSEIRKETRGRKVILTDRDVQRVEILLCTSGYDGRVLTWQELILECDFTCHWKTLYRIMGHNTYRRCAACKRSWITPKLAKIRVSYAKKIIDKYPEPSDWYNVRF
jgi:hypothetical protein